MNRLALSLIALASFALVACEGTSTPPTPAGDAAQPLVTACNDAAAPTTDAGAPDAQPDATPAADAGRTCSPVQHPYYPNVWYTVEIDSVTPARVVLDPVETGQLITLRGCGFLGVVDVQVSVMSVPFTIVDNNTIVATLPFWRRGDFEELPATVQIDIIKVQPDQVQIDLVLE